MKKYYTALCFVIFMSSFVSAIERNETYIERVRQQERIPRMMKEEVEGLDVSIFRLVAHTNINFEGDVRLIPKITYQR